MEKFSQKYAIVQFLDGVKVGDEFLSDAWPLHSTLIDTFAINWSADEMITKLTQSWQNHDTAYADATGERYFGKNGEVHVVALNRSDSLFKLHLDTLAALEKGGLVLNDPQFAREGFLPHSTVQRHDRIAQGDKIQFKNLSVVDMFPQKDPFKRKVLATISLGP